MNENDFMLIFKGIPCSPDEGRAYIDAQLAKFQGFILALKSARNSLSHISRLPQELLSLIFKDAYAVDYSSPKNIRVTHVCRIWRQIALDCTSLWSRPIISKWIRGNYQAILQETIARAKGFPLSIRMNEPTLLLHEFSTMLPPSIRPQILNLERIQELHIILSHEALEKLLDEVSGTDANNMRSITMQDIDAIARRLDESHILRASSVFSQNMPHLQHLALHHCGLPWDLMQSCTWDELLSLRLEYVLQPTTRRQFFNLLSRVPNVEILELRAVLPALDSEVIQNVTLSKLSSCTIASSSLAEYMDFHYHVSYPYNTAKLHFAFPTSTETTHLDYESSIHALLSSLGLSEQHSSARSHHNLLLDIEDHSPDGPELQLALWDGPTELNNSRLYYGVDDPSVSVKFPLTRSLMDRLLSMLLISGLKAVYFDSESEENYPDSQWLYFFRRHPEITRLHLRALCAPVFHALSFNTYEARTDDVEESEADSFDPGPPLPQLDTIIRDQGREEFYLPTIYQAEYDILVSCLVKRRERGKAVKKVGLPRLPQCGYQTYGVERIKKEVEEVVWDRPYGD